MLYNSWFKRVFNLKRQEVKQFTQLADSVGWISQGIMTLKEEEEITRKTETTRSKQTLPIADVFFVFVFNNSLRRLFSQIPPGIHGKDCQFVQAGKTCGIHCSVHFKSVRQQKTSQTVRTFPTYDRYLVACGRSQLAEETCPSMSPRWTHDETQRILITASTSVDQPAGGGRHFDCSSRNYAEHLINSYMPQRGAALGN